MKLTLSGKEFTLRCDMRALANAKRESGIDIGNLEEDAVQIGTLVYYMAQSGAKFAGVPFDYDLDDFLGLIDMADMEAMTNALVSLLGGGNGQKKSEGKPLTFDHCMQIGLGQLRFSPSVFYDMTFEEFVWAAQGMHKQEEARQQQEWERARWSAALALAPHAKKGQKVKPHDICIFPWEKKPKNKGNNKLLKNALNKLNDGKT